MNGQIWVGLLVLGLFYSMLACLVWDVWECCREAQDEEGSL